MSAPGAFPQVLLTTPGAWHLRQTGKAFERRDALAGVWVSDKNSTNIAASKFRRCWPFHLAMKPFYHLTSQIHTEKAAYAFFPIWKLWLQGQRAPACNVVQAIMGFASEPFDMAEKMDALKVVDCANSHPTTYFGFWQRECDRWCPGERVPIPQWMFARMNRELERADLILCPSKFVRESMILNGIAPGKCLINAFGVDTSIFRQRQTISATPPVCDGRHDLPAQGLSISLSRFRESEETATGC